MAVLTRNRSSMGYTPAELTSSRGRASNWAAGVMIVLLGAWGGIVPFVGPEFNFSADGSMAWTWSATHAWLFLVPGAVAVLSGLFVMTPRAGVATSGALFAVLAGAWFVIGPIAWPVVRGGPSFFSGDTSLRQLEFWVGYSLGPGVLVSMLGAYVIGRPKQRMEVGSTTTLLGNRSTAGPAD